jgi:hypothetical protein
MHLLYLQIPFAFSCTRSSLAAHANIVFVLYGRHDDPYAKLEAWARKNYPQCVGIVAKWSSHDYYPGE